MSPADAKAILKDIADLDVLINKYDDKRNPMFAAVGRYLFKGVRNDRAIEDLHRDLEDLTANQFFVDAAKFELYDIDIKILRIKNDLKKISTRSIR